MQHKNDYSVIAFFDENAKPKSWNFVHKLSDFVKFLNEKHAEWNYINVYERRTRKYLKRFYKSSSIPDFLLLFFLTFSFTFNGIYNPSTIANLWN